MTTDLIANERTLASDSIEYDEDHKIAYIYVGTSKTGDLAALDPLSEHLQKLGYFVVVLVREDAI